MRTSSASSARMARKESRAEALKNVCKVNDGVSFWLHSEPSSLLSGAMRGHKPNEIKAMRSCVINTVRQVRDCPPTVSPTHYIVWQTSSEHPLEFVKHDYLPDRLASVTMIWRRNLILRHSKSSNRMYHDWRGVSHDILHRRIIVTWPRVFV